MTQKNTAELSFNTKDEEDCEKQMRNSICHALNMQKHVVNYYNLFSLFD